MKKHTFGFVIAAVCFIAFVNVAASDLLPTVLPRMPGQKQANNVLLVQAKSSKLTLGKLIDAMGSLDVGKRRDASETIVALRNQYLSGAQHAVDISLHDKTSVRALPTEFDTLSFLRPASPEILQQADSNITFSWMPAVIEAPPGGEMQPAVRLLVRASFPALNILQSDFEDKVGHVSGVLSKPWVTRVKVVAAILGPSAPLWLHSVAQAQTNLDMKNGLNRYANDLSNANSIGQGITNLSSPYNAPGILRGFLNLNAINEQLDPADLDQINIDDYMINWNSADGLAKTNQESTGRPIPPWPSEHTSTSVIASHDIERTLALIQYNICLRLISDTNVKSVQKFIPYPPDARTDAIRVLGILRPTGFAAYTIWQRLRQKSMYEYVDTDTSQDTQTILRSLGQSDIPAVNLLTDKMATELDVRQRRAATYALSRILGRYSVPFIKQEIVRLNEDAKSDPDLHDQYLQQAQYVKEMLELGKEKKWFTGDYYGAHDPHAYDLQFPEDTARK